MSPLKVLIIGYVWPETNASAAGLRDWTLIEHFRDEEWEVAFASPAKESGFSQALQKLGLKIFSCQANDPQFDDFLKELSPNVVIFDRFIIEEQFGWRVEEICPHAIRILDTIDLHSLRRAREMAVKKSGFPLPKADLAFLRKYADEDFLREMSSILRSDLAVVVSSFEKELLTEIGVPKNQIALLRLSYRERTRLTPSFQERTNFVSIGNFRHPPNADAVLWMKKEIWPLLRAKTNNQAELHIYGAYPPKEMMALDDKATGFRVLGTAVDQYETLKKYRTLLAPLRFGAGIKGKISDSWWCGTSVASTSIGVEGMTDLFELHSADEIEDFANWAHRLWSDEELWLAEQAKGFEIIDCDYSYGENRKLLVEYIRRFQVDVEQQRRDNWQGALLRMNLNRGTKYMSKWIEAKNQLLKPV